MFRGTTPDLIVFSVLKALSLPYSYLSQESSALHTAENPSCCQSRGTVVKLGLVEKC